MSYDRKEVLERKINISIWITIVGLVLNGASAFALHTELNIILHFDNMLPQSVYDWLFTVREAISDAELRNPFMLYGYDWLGFAHLFIAIAFLGPLKDPVKNEWVVKFGMIVSALTVFISLFYEQVREIPFFWSLIDAAIGLAAFIILFFCNRWIKELKKLMNEI